MIADALQAAGHTVEYVTCGERLQTGCTAMSAFGVDARAPLRRRQEICKRCTSQASLLRREFHLRGPVLAEQVTAADEREVDALLARTTPENFLDLTVHGVHAGRLALYEYLLDAKKSSLKFDDEADWGKYRVALQNALYALLCGVRLFDTCKPDALVVYNSLYAVNNVVCHLADLRGIPRYMQHAGGNLAHRLDTMMLARGDLFDFMAHVKQVWERRRDRAVSDRAAAWVTDHFVELLTGRSPFAYSSAKEAEVDIRGRFGIGPLQKILCATMSSYDERFAAESIGARKPVTNLLFPYQVGWIRALVDYMKPRPELFLIIRVHPREFPNKRDGVKSAHAGLLEQVLKDLPANVGVNWPADGLSLYDLAEHVDVFLNAWSSVGKEMALLGIPVVVYSDDYLLYPAELNYVGKDRDAYFAAIERALMDGWRYENLRQAYRWCGLEYHDMLIDLSDSYAGEPSRPTDIASRAKRKLLRTIAPLSEQRADCRARASVLAAGRQVAAVFERRATSILDLEPDSAPESLTLPEEAAVLQRELGRLAQVLFRGRPASQASPLREHIEAFVRDDSAIIPEKGM